MSEMALRELIAHAVVNTRMCADLLTEERESVLSQFELSEAERCALEQIRARSLQAFAAQLESWMQSQPYEGFGAKVLT
jgi:hypothetical protein